MVLPQTEIGDDPGVLRDFALTAEQLGYSHILAFDHVLGAERDHREPPFSGPYSEKDSFHEPLTLFAFMSGFTKTIGFVTGVLVLPQRQTSLVAKQSAEVALLSGDRLRLGIGVGWNYVEYQGMSQDFHNRGKRQEEQVQLLRELWSGRVLDFEGQWHRLDRVAMSPAPHSQIPIWFGGFSPAAHERAARLGDGFLFARVGKTVSSGRPTNNVQTIIEQAEHLRRLVEAAGRDPLKFGLEGRVNYRDGKEIWRQEYDAFESAGFDFIAVNTMNAGLTSPADHISALSKFAEAMALPRPH